MPKMRKFVLFSCTGLAVMFIGVGIGRATDKVAMDGSWWQNDVPESSRMNATEAAMSAYEVGWAAGSNAEGSRIFDEAEKFSPTLGGRVFNIVYRKENGRLVQEKMWPNYSRTFAFYSTAITDFYVTRSDATKATVGDVIGCLADHPEYTCDNVEKLAASER
jgi:hypothetical protein